MELKSSFPEVFSAGLGKCTKIKAKFEPKENTRSIFLKEAKRTVRRDGRNKRYIYTVYIYRLYIPFKKY